ncbi:secretin [Chelydra serpentina]|uniref:Secretin n=1 Tax=Chelydra serpentina TaxID=8475 RepID=A0A8T1SDF0_CHESE|nr:secretin [Chelydra serpentina]
MASLLTGLWQLVISVVVLSQLSATLPPLERARRHADGVFNSELSKMNENAYVQKLVKSLVGLNQRYQRHSDGTFTSELSKMRGNAQVQKLIKSLVGYKRSVPKSSGLEGRMEDSGFIDHAENDLSLKEKLTKLKAFLHHIQNLRGSDEVDGSEGLIHTDLPRAHETGSSHDDFCFMWLYQSFLNDSLSESDAREATQMTGQYICPASKPLIEEMKEEVSVLD